MLSMLQILNFSYFNHSMDSILDNRSLDYEKKTKIYFFVYLLKKKQITRLRTGVDLRGEEIIEVMTLPKAKYNFQL